MKAHECEGDERGEEVPESNAERRHKFFLLPSDASCFHDVWRIHQNRIDARQLLEDGQHDPRDKRDLRRQQRSHKSVNRCTNPAAGLLSGISLRLFRRIDERLLLVFLAV